MWGAIGSRWVRWKFIVKMGKDDLAAKWCFWSAHVLVDHD